MPYQERPMTTLRPTACSANGADLNSLQSTRLPTITFMSSKEHDFPVVILKALNPLGACMILKEWLYEQLKPYLAHNDQLLRLEPLELFLLDPKKTGSLMLLEQAAKIEDVEFKGPCDGIPISVFALVMPKDPCVRFFYIQGPITSLLERLASEACISRMVRMIKPKSRVGGREHATPDHHCRLYTWLQEAFLSALAIPDHQDYANAMSLTDYAPFIKDFEDDPALRRLERCDGLYATKDEAKNLEDDRYVFALEVAERTLASLIGLGCGEYLLIKRNFFRAFKDDVLHSEKKLVKANAKVRTEFAHAQWLERVYEWKLTRAKRLVLGLRELGLLEEKRILAWIRSGGQFEFGDHYEEE